MFINGDEVNHINIKPWKDFNACADWLDEVNHINMKHPVNWIGIYPDHHILVCDIGFSQISVHPIGIQ